VKVIIFDFDDTLYNGKVWGNLPIYMKTFLLKQFNNDKEKTDAFVQKYSIDKQNYFAQTIANSLISEFGSAKSFADYQTTNIYPLQATDLKFVDENFLKQLALKFPIYIVTNSSFNFCTKLLKENNIDTNIFKGIYSNQFEADDPTKKRYYEQIIEKEKVKATDVLVVGDNFVNDLMPAIELGCKTFFVQTLDELYAIPY